MPSHPRSESPDFQCVDRNTCFWHSELPDLGLVLSRDLPFRIYALACEPSYVGGPKNVYCGIEHRSQIWRRVNTQEGQGELAAHYCQVHKPQWIMGIWPVATRAAEAYLFAALVANRGEEALGKGRLGGWTQTSAELSNVSKMMLWRERRMVASDCLDCGSNGHAAVECERVAYAFVTCKQCNAQNRLSDRGVMLSAVPPQGGSGQQPLGHGQGQGQGQGHGQAQRAPRQGGAGQAAVGQAAGVAAAGQAAAGQAAAGQAGQAGQAAAGQQAVAPPARTFNRVRLTGVSYTTLGWYLGKENPTPMEVREALQAGLANAAQLRTGSPHTFVRLGFARRGPHLGAELYAAGNGALPNAFRATAAKAVRSGAAVEIKKAPAGLKGTGGRLLFRVADLDSVRVLKSRSV